MVINTLRDIIVDAMGARLKMDASEIDKTTEFIADLHADSVDIATIICDIEDAFDIEIEDEQLEGIETVGEAMNNDITYSFLNKCMKEEILPTIGENDDSIAFANAVFDRFKNPFIAHKWRSIALNSVSKFAVRDLPTLLEYKEKNGKAPKCLTLALANLIYFYKNDTSLVKLP